MSARKLVVTITMEGAAFADPHGDADGEARAFEAARVLERLRDRLNRTGELPADGEVFRLLDSNGNTCGAATVRT